MDEKEQQEEWVDESWTTEGQPEVQEEKESRVVELKKPKAKPKREEKSESPKSESPIKIKRLEEEENEAVVQKRARKTASVELTGETASGPSLLQDVGVWRFASLLLGALLVVSLFTGGLNNLWSSGKLSQEEASQKAISFINNIQPGLTATLQKTDDVGDLYKLELLVAGQPLDSYITKDGRLLFPQGLDLLAPSLPPPPRSQPQGARVQVDADDDAVLGNPDAPVTIIEFSDYQCPFCRTFWEDTLPELKSKYIETGKVNLIFRDFPLEFHPAAIPAAIAAECAEEEGKYWDMHDKMFAEQQKQGGGTVDFDTEDLKKWAADIGLNTATFNTCLDEQRYKSEVEKDSNDGAAAGVDGTPAFFINGVKLSGAQPFAAFASIIESELADDDSEDNVIDEPIVDELADELPTTGTENTPEFTPESIPTKEPVVEAKPVKSVGTATASITAKRWRFDPSTVKLRKGTNVILKVASTDADVRFVLSEYGVDLDLTPGQTETAEFFADREGQFTYTCSDCDGKESIMKGILTVE